MSAREKPQIDNFQESARERETDQSEQAFDHVLKKVIREAHPREGASPIPTKKAAKAPPPKDEKARPTK
ncbi:DNA-binding protein [Mesorhizobium sp. M0293]|uniref:DNA-binding protein n=1 Tax=Mesorhizobium sp. M0293 TaxID=2956930 RepID=UPI003338090F